MNNQIHIGEVIKKVMKEKGISATWLAKQIPCSESNIYKILKKASIECKILRRISKILDHNFCEDTN
jgi:predicted transcriptional regulator